MGIGRLLILGGVALTGLILARRAGRLSAIHEFRQAGAGTRRRGDQHYAAFSETVSDEFRHERDASVVRPAGPESMRDSAGRDWDRVDEASDESFPASDPPARY